MRRFALKSAAACTREGRRKGHKTGQTLARICRRVPERLVCDDRTMAPHQSPKASFEAPIASPVNLKANKADKHFGVVPSEKISEGRSIANLLPGSMNLPTLPDFATLEKRRHQSMWGPRLTGTFQPRASRLSLDKSQSGRTDEVAAGTGSVEPISNPRLPLNFFCFCLAKDTAHFLCEHTRRFHHTAT